MVKLNLKNPEIIWKSGESNYESSWFCEVDFAYLPMWSNNDDLSKVLVELIENICPVDEIDAVGISMTAELVDAYDTKKDGVLDVVAKCEQTFDCPIAYVGIDGMMSKGEIEKTPLQQILFLSRVEMNVQLENLILTGPLPVSLSTQEH